MNKNTMTEPEKLLRRAVDAFVVEQGGDEGKGMDKLVAYLFQVIAQERYPGKWLGLVKKVMADAG